MAELGTVISTFEGPTTISFSFVVLNPKVRKGQFVQVNESTGIVLASVTEITRANRYFERAESVAEYEKNLPLPQSFPTEDWEYVVANARVHGVIDGGNMIRSTFPVAPGSKVYEADEELLKKFLLFDGRGLEIGNIAHHSLPAKLSMGRLFQKHLAILAMSGSGKSYLTSVMIEEMLERKMDDGRMAVVIIDNHGEYVGFRQTSHAKNVDVVDGKKFKIAFRKVTPHMLAEWSEMSSIQLRELVPVMEKLRKEAKEKREVYTIDDLIGRVEKEISKDTIRRPLLAWLSELRSLHIFGAIDNPRLEDIVSPGRLVVFDLSEIDDAKRKQIIVAYLARRLFRMRKKGKISPFLLILEEAHNFAPEKAEKKYAIAKGQIIKIAREGRKFGACLCLISQRPVHLATTALSQCNSSIILRITNPFDIEHIGQSCEGIDKAMLDSITTLRVGEALIVGEAVGCPVFVKIRKRRTNIASKGKELEKLAKEYEEEKVRKKEDVEAFL